ncbi:MAG: SDR family NAD(P)-dependent oxidoreductase [Thermoanaerobaculia bacterium]|nr:SDR family NAD(P)-dependent oxidoreductase [Thermoanaerobaculia bacterium]
MNQRFFVTGSASGIGRHLTQVLLDRGAEVWATDVDPSGLEALQNEHGTEKLHVRRLDVTDPAAWRAVFGEAEAAGPVDVLLNVAGYLRPGHLVDATDADVDRHFDVNVKGVALGTRTAARAMRARGRGHVINFASLAAMAPIPGLTLYSASKFAVRALSLAAAEELRPLGIAVTALCPDAVQTPMLDLQVGYDEAALTFSAPRILSVEDVARVVLGPVLSKRPLVVCLPWHRGWLARFADLFPRVSRWLAPALRRKGRQAQAARRGV